MKSQVVRNRRKMYSTGCDGPHELHGIEFIQQIHHFPSNSEDEKKRKEKFQKEWDARRAYEKEHGLPMSNYRTFP